MSKPTNLKDSQHISFIGIILAARGAAMFLSSKNQKKLLLHFYKILQTSHKIENSKNCKFIKQFREWILKIFNKKWYVIDSESKSGYSHEDPIKFLTKSIESSLCDYSEACILVTGNITVTRTIAGDPNADSAVKKRVKQLLTAARQVAFKTCAPFDDCRTKQWYFWLCRFY